MESFYNILLLGSLITLVACN